MGIAIEFIRSPIDGDDFVEARARSRPRPAERFSALERREKTFSRIKNKLNREKKIEKKKIWKILAEKKN